MRHRVVIEGVPAWVDASRLLGVDAAEFAAVEAGEGWVRIACELERAVAADVDARLRGVGLGGRLLRVVVTPPLPRAAVRQARLLDARRRRETTPGFERAGTRLDREGRFSLTPERLALDVAALVAGRRVLDAGCGAGGNAIAFARAGCAVVAVERDPGRLAMARHNARVYGVASAIRFVEGDACEELGGADVDVAFVDPPWGEAWDRARTVAGDFPLLGAVAAITHRRRIDLLAKLPPSFDPSTLAAAVPSATFGASPGDTHRIKFLLLRR